MLDGGSEEKWSRFVTAYSAGTRGNGNTQPPPKAICVSVQGKNLSICSPLRLAPAGPRIDFETSMRRCGCTLLGISDAYRWMADEGGGGGVVGREPNLKSDPLIFVVCLRGSSAGQVGARALRQEQRGGCMGGWATGGW